MTGFKSIPLGELCRIELGKTPARGSASNWDIAKETGNVWLSIADMPTTTHAEAIDSREYVSASAAKDMKIVPKGTLLVSFKLTLGRLCYAGRDLYTNEAIAALHDLDESRILKAYLYWYLTYFDWHAASAGEEKVKGKTLNKAKLKVLPVLVPSLDEQVRIVAILDQAFAALDRARAHAEANLANADVLFLQMASESLDQIVRASGTAPVGEVADHCLGKMLDKKKNTGALRPYLRNLNVRWFSVDTSDVLEMQIEDHEAERYEVRKGDLLICEGGYPGRAAIYDSDDTIYFQKALHRVRFKDPNLSKVLMYWLYVEDRLGRLKSHFSGTGISHFTGKALAAYQMPVAAEDVTSNVVSRIDSSWADTRKLVSAYEEKLADIAVLRQSLLQQAFSGQLT